MSPIIPYLANLAGVLLLAGFAGTAVAYMETHDRLQWWHHGLVVLAAVMIAGGSTALLAWSV